MDVQTVMAELAALGQADTKRIYQNHGAREPQFGVAVADLRKMAKKIKKDHPLAEQLYATGNYDAMYLAGMVADPALMEEADLDRWLADAYFFMLSDYVVAPLLAQKAFAKGVAERWIATGKELSLSAGYTCYALLLCTLPDESFDRQRLSALLAQVKESLHSQPPRARYAMNGFVIALGVSYLPLHGEAVEAAQAIGQVKVMDGKVACAVPLATAMIAKAESQGKLGYKRKG